MLKRSPGEAAQAGIDALVVMWQGADALKVEATRGYGAAVDQAATDPTTAFERLAELQEETGRTLVHPFNDPAVIAGQGTVGLEMLEDVPDADVVLVPVGGGGLVSGIAVAVKALRPAARVIAVEPELSPALHDALAAGHSVPVTPRSAANALSAPFAGERSVEICGARRRVGARLRRRSLQCISLALRAHEARLRARRGGIDGGTSLRKGDGRAGSDRGRCRLGRERRSPTGRCYSGFMKTGIHPEYVLTTVACSCGNSFQTRSTKPGAARRGLLRVPPVLHGQAEAHGHRRPGGALPEAARTRRARQARAETEP